MGNTVNIYKRMSGISTEIGTVAKNLEVTTGKGKGYKAVSEADVLRAVKPMEAKYGVYSYPYDREIIQNELITSETYDGKTRNSFFMRVRVTYRFVNIDNPEEFIDIVAYGDGIDTADKAPGKAVTYADKYALMKAYKLVTGDDPDQEHSDNVLPERYSVEEPKKTPKNIPATAEQIRLIQQNAGDRLENLLKYYKVSTINELNVVQASEAIKTLGKEKKNA